MPKPYLLPAILISFLFVTGITYIIIFHIYETLSPTIYAMGRAEVNATWTWAEQASYSGLTIYSGVMPVALCAAIVIMILVYGFARRQRDPYQGYYG